MKSSLRFFIFLNLVLLNAFAMDQNPEQAHKKTNPKMDLYMRNILNTTLDRFFSNNPQQIGLANREELYAWLMSEKDQASYELFDLSPESTLALKLNFQKNLDRKFSMDPNYTSFIQMMDGGWEEIYRYEPENFSDRELYHQKVVKYRARKSNNTLGITAINDGRFILQIEFDDVNSEELRSLLTKNDFFDGSRYVYVGEDISKIRKFLFLVKGGALIGNLPNFFPNKLLVK